MDSARRSMALSANSSRGLPLTCSRNHVATRRRFLSTNASRMVTPMAPTSVATARAKENGSHFLDHRHQEPLTISDQYNQSVRCSLYRSGSLIGKAYQTEVGTIVGDQKAARSNVRLRRSRTPGRNERTPGSNSSLPELWYTAKKKPPNRATIRGARLIRVASEPKTQKLQPIRVSRRTRSTDG